MPISDPETLKDFLSAHGLKPNKALGQNFFIDMEKLTSIVEASHVDGLDIIEIGPGPGALTELLLPRVSRLIAVEKDATMSALLTERLGTDDRLTVRTADILRFDMAHAFDGAFSVCGNLPYYITTPIAERILLACPVSATIMVQREAADRFLAHPGDRVYGPLAILSQLFYEPSRLLDIPRSCYYPQPDVDSAVVRLVRRPSATRETVAAMNAFLNQAFLMRRKTLFNNLGRTENVAEAIRSIGADPAIRAEALAPEQLLSLYRRLHPSA